MEYFKRAFEALAISQSSGVNPALAHLLLGKVALSLGDLSQAEVYFKQLMAEKFNWIGPFASLPQFNLAIQLRLLGLLAVAKGQLGRAVSIFGAIYDWEARFSGYYCPKERMEYETALATARSGLGEAAFESAWQAGKRMSLEEITAFAAG